MRDGIHYGGRLEIVYDSREDAHAQAPAWVAYRCALEGLRTTGEIAYADTALGNCRASVTVEHTEEGALRAAMREHAPGSPIPQAALDEARRLDAAYAGGAK